LFNDELGVREIVGGNDGAQIGHQIPALYAQLLVSQVERDRLVPCALERARQLSWVGYQELRFIAVVRHRDATGRVEVGADHLQRAVGRDLDGRENRDRVFAL